MILNILNFTDTVNSIRGMEHSACLEEFDDVEAFLSSRLPALNK